jgi:hypothetical protein
MVLQQHPRNFHPGEASNQPVKSFQISKTLQAGLLALAFGAPSTIQAQDAGEAVSPKNTQSKELAALDLPDAPDVQVPAAAPSAPAQDPAAKPDQTPATSSSTPQQPTPLSAEDEAKKKHEEAERELKEEEKQRLLGIMPQFQVVMGGQAVPLSAREKWSLALHSAIDPFYIGWAFVVGGGIGELDGSHPGFGWGPSGYFKRVGATYADNLNGALVGNALLPAVLHQDPRYFRKGSGSFPRRFVHAALSTVICHGDNGKNQFNTSNVLGNFISGAISNAYYPANERGVALTLENGAQVTLVGALGGQLLEFGPDLARLVSRKHHKPAPPPTP